MEDEAKIYIIVASIFGVFMLTLFTVASYIEAQTFNKCTGSQVTIVDAAFSELRVEECKQ